MHLNGLLRERIFMSHFAPTIENTIPNGRYSFLSINLLFALSIASSFPESFSAVTTSQ